MKDQGFSIYLCHAYLNTLYAGFQGKYARLKALNELLDEEILGYELENTCVVIDSLAIYLQDLWDQKPIDFNTEEDLYCNSTLECINYLYMLESELIEGVRSVTEVLCKPDHQFSYTDLALLCGHLIQRAYTREHYIKGLIQYGDNFELSDTSERWTQHLASCEKEIVSAHKLFELLKDVESVTPLLVNEMREESLFIPALLECQIHDMNQVTHLHRDDFNHMDARILGSAYHLWEAAGIPAQFAGYWKAYGFLPHEVYDWLEFGFQEPALAGAWFGRGFDPAEALMWAEAGYGPKEAFSCIQAGLISPAHAEEWQLPDDLMH